MKFTCSNLRKTDNLKANDKGYSFLKEDFKAKNVYFIPATLKNEHAQLFMVVDGTFKKKQYLQFKSTSWLTGITDDTCDEDAVKALNKKVVDLFHNVTELGGTLPVDLDISARVHKTTIMSPLMFCKGLVLSSDSLYYRKTDEIDVIFCERVTSYTKTFDISFVMKDKSVETHSCLDRKRLSSVFKWSEENNIEIYQTGPDPLNWKDMHNCHKNNTWKEINQMLNEVDEEEEEESEWDEEMTESETETESEEDYPSEESESDYAETDEDEDEDYAFSVGKHPLSDSDSEEEYRSKKTKY